MEVLAVLSRAQELLRPPASSFEPDLLSSSDAVRVYESAAALRRLAEVFMNGAAGRVDSGNGWQASGANSAAQFLANRSGDDQRNVASVIATEKRLAELPDVRDAYRAGELSSAQAAAVAREAAKAPELARSFLETARKYPSVNQLRRTLAEATQGRDTASEQLQAYEHKRAQRKAWAQEHLDEQGFSVTFSGTLDDYALLKPEWEARTDAMWRKATREGRNEGFSAYRYDALIDMLLQRTPKKLTARHRTLVQVDDEALERGYVVPGERSQVVGIGPIAVVAMKKLLPQPQVRRVTRAQVDVANELVGSMKEARAVKTSVVLQVILRDDGRCANPGCDNIGKHLDHRRPATEGGPPSVENLALLCPQCHRLKSRQGWAVIGEYGTERTAWVQRRPRGDGGSGYELNDNDEYERYFESAGGEACPRAG